jgi:hypothetical protein
MQQETARRLREHYRLMLSEARTVVTEEWLAAGHPGVRLAGIGPQALIQAGQWQNRKVDWDWAELEERWSRKPKHFGFSVWVDPKLCALGLGRISDGSVIARLDRLERASTTTDDEIAQVAELAILFLETLGKIVGCRDVALWHPAEGLIQYYKDFGYETEIIERGKIIGLKRQLFYGKG